MENREKVLLTNKSPSVKRSKYYKKQGLHPPQKSKKKKKKEYN